MAGGTQVSCACPDACTHPVWCTNDRICFFFWSLPLITKTRKKPRTDLDGPPERCPSCFGFCSTFELQRDVESGCLLADLDVHSICVGMPHWRAHVHAVRVDGPHRHLHLPMPVAAVEGANLLGVPPPSFVVGHCAMCWADQTSTTHCMTGVLVTLVTPAPTDCAKSEEFMVPDSGTMIKVRLMCNY